MESRLTKEASDLQTTGELVNKPATRVNSPTLAMRRSHDGSRLEIPVRTLRSHSRGGRSSVCVQDSTNQAGNFPLCRESSLDRATRPNNPSSVPETLPDRPLSTVVGRDLSPPPVEMGNSEILSSDVPTDETSASFHSTPEFHVTPQTLGSHIYLEFPTTIGSVGPNVYPASQTFPSPFYAGSHTKLDSAPAHTDFYTGPLPVPTTTINPVPGFYTGPTPVTTHTPGPGLYTISQTGRTLPKILHLYVLSAICAGNDDIGRSIHHIGHTQC